MNDGPLRRLRHGEWIAGIGALVLLASMFLLAWYRVTSGSGAAGSALHPITVDGWHALTTLRWLMLATIAAALMLACAQASRRAPAIPTALSMIVTVLGIVTALFLLVRVLIDPPALAGNVSTRAGAYVGLLAALVLAFGAYESFRQEGIAPGDGPSDIPTVGLRNQ